MEAPGVDCNGRPCTNTTNLRLLEILMNLGVRNVCVRKAKLIHGRGKSGSRQEIFTNINMYIHLSMYIYSVSIGVVEGKAQEGQL